MACTFVAVGLAACEAGNVGDTSGLDSRVGSSLVDAARSSEERRDYTTAAGYYRSAYERTPEALEVVIGLSRNLRYLDRPREAEAIVDRALRKSPEDPHLLAERGKVHLANLEAAEAVELLSRAAEKLAGDWNVQTALAVSYDRLGLYDQAEQRYQKALALAPDNPVVLNNHGLSLAQRGQLRQAVETLRRAASQPDATVQMRQNLALMHAVDGDLLRTEELVRRDLPAELADANMVYYRRIATNRRLTDAGDAVRAAADQQGPGGTPVAAVPLPPPSVAPAPAEDEVAAAPVESGPETAAASVPTQAKPAPATAEDPGDPVPLTPADKPAAADRPADAALAEARDQPAVSDQPATPYQLQLASFRREEQAEQARRQLLARHKEVLGDLELQVSRISLGDRGDYFRVISAPLSTRDAAADLCRVLKTRRADCLLVRAAAE